MTNILFVDIDGTLVVDKDGTQYIPPSATEAMAEVRRRGGRCYLCTGRSLAEARTNSPALMVKRAQQLCAGR